MSTYYGKYRGEVVNNIDPMMQGRVQVKVPTVLLDSQLAWAMPCMPYGGRGVGFFAVPPNGAKVWVEFERGDTNYPIYTGCYWEAGEAPAQPAIPQMKMWKTDGITLTLSDVPGAGGLTIEVSPPVVAMPLKAVFNTQGIELSQGGTTKVVLSATGIELSFGPANVKLGPTGVNINNGALEVM
ncbi:baseplate assembly protein [Pyxidicoccus parkwayensis]|uniref:Baseplate assembly protein n=1 Tax=Pyxidicoccus parkwayensis TaxID=2813578 RepID=A0ABX7PAU2_9BACT|nr:phage baseplate assembly protein V [Pyxidicoccus parkwaysis]QSQ27586.1 baseplate assembly protein [Pyxidicoccus parkwaysis]